MSHLQHSDICHVFQKLFLASTIHSHFLINSQDIVYCATLLFGGHGTHNTLYAWVIFSLAVIYSRLDNLLFILTQSLWLHCNSESHVNAKRTSLWTNLFLVFHHKLSVTTPYPSLLRTGDSSLGILPQLYLRLFTLPSLLTWYFHSYHGMSLKISFIFFLLNNLTRARSTIICLHTQTSTIIYCL